MVSEPEYSSGEIVVKFKGDCSEEFARDFGGGLGYELSSDTSYEGNYVFRTEEGKEQEAVLTFAGYTEFVDWASRRDVGLERRWEKLDEVKGAIGDLCDSADSSHGERLSKIERVISQLNSLKDL